jgi:hypothetical protein
MKGKGLQAFEEFVRRFLKRKDVKIQGFDEFEGPVEFLVLKKDIPGVYFHSKKVP